MAVPLLKKEADLYPHDLFSRGQGLGPWWVAHVRSRQEKGLARHLLEQQVPFYLPIEERSLRRKGRQRTSYLPLFPGYLFFKGEGAERLATARSHLVVRTLQVNDQPRLHSELESLWSLQAAGCLFVPHPYLGPGDEVEILDGPFKGFQGRILREQGRARLVVSVTFLRRAVATTIDRDLLAPAPAAARSSRAIAVAGGR